MQTVSQSWKDAHKQTILNESFVEISLDVADPDSIADASATDNGAAFISDTSRVTKEEIEEAYSLVDEALLDVIRKALVNIRAFHEKQRRYSWFDSEESGILLGQKITALHRVGVYVPGGKAVYPSVQRRWNDIH